MPIGQTDTLTSTHITHEPVCFRRDLDPSADRSPSTDSQSRLPFESPRIRCSWHVSIDHSAQRVASNLDGACFLAWTSAKATMSHLL